MAFIKESPISQFVLDRCNWKAIPLIYQGEAGSFALIPSYAVVDYDKDAILAIAGGGGGRTSGIFQEFTYVFLYKGDVVRLTLANSDKKYELDPETNIVAVWTYFEWTITRLIVPVSCESKIGELVDALIEAVYVYEKCPNKKELAVKLSIDALEYC